MQKEITLYDEKVVYTLRKSRRARRMRLVVSRDGSIVVILPLAGKEILAERFILAKSKWLLSKLDYFRKRAAERSANPISRFTAADYVKYKGDATALIRRKVEYFNTLYGYTYGSINIKNQKTRWGSCSRQGNLNFNYKILFLPEAMQDYIVVHELCHLEAFNHSKRFWQLVAKTIPNPLALRKELRKSGLAFD